MARKVYYVLELFAEGCVAEFFVNDLPVVRRGDELGKTFNGQCNHQLRPGVNELTVVVEPGSVPSRSLVGDGGRSRKALGRTEVRAALTRYPHGATMGGPSREELLSFTWRSPDSGEPASWPQVRGATVDLGDLWGPPVWDDAEPLALTPKTLGEVRQFLQQLRSMLDRRNWDAFFDATRPRLQGIERAYRLSAGSKEAHHRMLFEADAKRAGFGFEPLRPDAYDFRLCGGGRLVECIDREWTPVLRENATARGDQHRYDMMLAKLDGGWKVVL